MQQLLLFYHSRSNNWKFVIVFFFVSMSALSLFAIFNWQMKRFTSSNFDLFSTYQPEMDSAVQHYIPLMAAEAKQIDFIKQQYRVVTGRKLYFRSVALVFFRNYYSSSLITMIYGCIGGLVLFLLVKNGWKDVSISVQAIFLSIVAVVSFSGLFAPVFMQEKNMNSHLQSFVDYSKVQTRIQRQLARLSNPYFTSKYIQRSEKDSLLVTDTISRLNQIDVMIDSNAQAIITLTNISLSIDTKHITNIKELSKAYGVIDSSK